VEGSLTTTVTETQEGRERQSSVYFLLYYFINKIWGFCFPGSLGILILLAFIFLLLLRSLLQAFKPQLLNLTGSIITGFRFVHHLIRLEAFPFLIFSLSNALVMVIFQLKTIKSG
jgi:hypothetical protein